MARKESQVIIYFYPRPPRGGRLDVCSYRQCVDRISIHALREEGDACAVAIIR